MLYSKISTVLLSSFLTTSLVAGYQYHQGDVYELDARNADQWDDLAVNAKRDVYGYASSNDFFLDARSAYPEAYAYPEASAEADFEPMIYARDEYNLYTREAEAYLDAYYDAIEKRALYLREAFPDADAQPGNTPSKYDDETQAALDAFGKKDKTKQKDLDKYLADQQKKAEKEAKAKAKEEAKQKKKEQEAAAKKQFSESGGKRR
ncbi:hypothetical protein MMC19_006886 [Ptychographa xylographoides]|nr:hypothetical protein [Ptychographa xylographoides]